MSAGIREDSIKLRFTRAWSMWREKEILPHLNTYEICASDYVLQYSWLPPALTFPHFKVASVLPSAVTARWGSLSIIYSIDCPSTYSGVARSFLLNPFIPSLKPPPLP